VPAKPRLEHEQYFKYTEGVPSPASMGHAVVRMAVIMDRKAYVERII
jgi:hypothetical protein